MGQEIEKLSEAEFQRELERGPTARSRVKQAATGAAMTAGSAGLISLFPELSALVMTPVYVVGGMGILLVVAASVSWMRQRRRAREEPPLPPARLLDD